MLGGERMKKDGFNALTILLILGLICLCQPMTAQAQNQPKLDAKAQDDMIVKRQTLMEEMYEITTPRAKPAEPAKLQAQAGAIAGKLAALKALFPPETNPQHSSFQASLPTYALPAIWQDPSKFARDLETNERAVDALQHATESAQLAKLAERVVQACEACHLEFRAAYQSPFDVK